MTEVKCALGVLTDTVNRWNQDHRLRLRFHGTTNEAWSGGRQCALSVWDVSNSDLLAWEVDAVTTDIELKVRIGIAPDDQARDAWAKIGQLSADTWGAIIEPVSAEASEGDDQQVAKIGLQDVDQIVIPLPFDEVDGMIIDAVPGGVHYTREMINPSTAVYRLSWSGMIYDKRVAYDDIGLIKLFKSGDKEAILSLKDARAIYDYKHLEVMRACHALFYQRLLVLLEPRAAAEKETSADDRPQPMNIIADNLGGTLVYTRNEQGQMVVSGTVRSDYLPMLLPKHAVIVPERDDIQPNAFEVTSVETVANNAGHRGRQSEWTQEEKDAIVIRWVNKDKRKDARTLGVFLVDEIGEKPSDADDFDPRPNISKRQFYTWRKDYLKRNPKHRNNRTSRA